MEFHEIRDRLNGTIDEVEKVIVGKRSVVELACIALLANGHLLIEDVPGTGKTMLARALARALECTFKRIQFTPDLLPSDITGTSVYNQKDSEFEFRAGPIFANVVLADEINRATPKTQSSLLECMEEFQVSVDGVTRPLPNPFFVVATQNNIEYQGTYPLPEAQLDRFVMRLAMGYPTGADEVAILNRQEHAHPIETVSPVLSGVEVELMRRGLRQVRASTPVKEYIVQLAAATREHEAVLLGVSPRASLDLMHCAQAMAGIRGRDYVLPDDVKDLATVVFSHRLMLRPDIRLRRLSGPQVVQEVLQQVSVPLGEAVTA